MNAPPPATAIPPRRRGLSRIVIGLIVACVLLAVVGAALAVRAIIASGITRGPDYMFGDQHLKTTVALIELHRTRYGKYPDSLDDLKFTGAWDAMALHSVKYCPAEDRRS